MGTRQQEFLVRFRSAFESRFAGQLVWAGGQVLDNTAGLEPDLPMRREGKARPGERFELGDLRCDFGESTVVVEYESGAMHVHNLLKYWPYLRGELSSGASRPLVLCHFSDWSSYGSYRDLWKWLRSRISEDPSLKVAFRARQFDHGGSHVERADRSLTEATTWLQDTMDESHTA